MQPSFPSGNVLFAAHPRGFHANRYVYPVLSRRAGGISIGVNLSPDKFCNFRCVYCQVDRSEADEFGEVDLTTLAAELDRMVEWVTSGGIFQGPQFRNTAPQLRRLNDIALSGNGEPTACPNFEQVVDVCAEIRRRRKLDGDCPNFRVSENGTVPLGAAENQTGQLNGVKLVLITNAALLHQLRVRRALETLDRNGGEIWAKLDAGTEGYYRQIDRSTVPWQRILDNLREAAIARPIVIQSLFLQIRGELASPAELAAYCQRLDEIAAGGGHIKLVQIHTIARQPAEAWATPLADAEVDAIAELVRCRTGLPVAAFYGGGAAD